MSKSSSWLSVTSSGCPRKRRCRLLINVSMFGGVASPSPPPIRILFTYLYIFSLLLSNFSLVCSSGCVFLHMYIVDILSVLCMCVSVSLLCSMFVFPCAIYRCLLDSDKYRCTVLHALLFSILTYPSFVCTKTFRFNTFAYIDNVSKSPVSRCMLFIILRNLFLCTSLTLFMRLVHRSTTRLFCSFNKSSVLKILPTVFAKV